MMESIFDSIVRNMREYPAQGYYVALPVPPHTKTVIPVLWPTPEKSFLLGGFLLLLFFPVHILSFLFATETGVTHSEWLTLPN